MHSLPLRESGFSTPCPLLFFFHLFVCAVRVAGEGGGDAGAVGTHQLLKGRASLF